VSAAAPPAVVDVSSLPRGTVDSRELIWWAFAGIIAIEGTMFAITAATYLYLAVKSTDWPPLGTPLPGLLIPTLDFAALLLSIVPSVGMDRAAQRDDVKAMRLWTAWSLPVDALCVTLRFLLIRNLPFRWNSHAYGSIVWSIVGLHTFHLVASTLESILLAIIVFRERPTQKTRRDLRVDGFYWLFVTLSWVPFYVLLFLSPRWK
jgi:heme/copper-type cytochrome/quinol oxidase subunit 3